MDSLVLSTLKDLALVFLKIRTCQFLAVTSDFRYVFLTTERTKCAWSNQNKNQDNNNYQKNKKQEKTQTDSTQPLPSLQKRKKKKCLYTQSAWNISGIWPVHEHAWIMNTEARIISFSNNNTTTILVGLGFLNFFLGNSVASLQERWLVH